MEKVPFTIKNIAEEPCLVLKDKTTTRLVINADLVLDISFGDGVYELDVLRDDTLQTLTEVIVLPEHYVD